MEMLLWRNIFQLPGRDLRIERNLLLQKTSFWAGWRYLMSCISTDSSRFQSKKLLKRRIEKIIRAAAEPNSFTIALK